MPFTSRTPEEIQRRYYEETAGSYDDMHTSAADEHYAALAFIDMTCQRLGFKSIFDVGAGTGRGLRYLQQPGRDVRGVEPVKALIDQAELQGVAKGLIMEGTGYALPVADCSYDAVIESGVLHHVADPDRVVNEMMRVAKQAIFISDSNRFGQGRSQLVRLLKLVLYKAHLWHAVRFISTRGRMYTISEGDGLAYSYSVFDSYSKLSKWADTIWLIPLASAPNVTTTWAHPLLTTPHVLLCAFKKH